MNLRELEAQAEFLAPVIAAAVAKAVAPLKEQIAQRDDRIADLTKRLDELPAPVAPDLEAIAKLVQLPEVKDGTSVTVDDVRPLLEELVSKVQINVPSAEAVAALVDTEALAKSAAARIEKPQDGKSVYVEDVRPMLEDMVKALPKPENGKDANMAELKLHLGELVKSIEVPQPQPAPTVDEVAATFERRFSDLTLSWERQARDTFEKAADRMPKPADGRDAIPLEGFDLTLAEDGRTVIVKMQAGETVIEKSVKIAAVLDRGIFKQEGTYEKGDGMTYGGCYWIATVDAPEGVPGVSKDFRLAVKKGRDGKDLRENASKVDPTKGVSIR
ncbi:MAG: portal protein [Caudoviricetes sp.]|nr:MAG: portal protein [Caudoviricetes sp.]